MKSLIRVEPDTPLRGVSSLRRSAKTKMKAAFSTLTACTCSILFGGCCCFTSFDLDNRTGQRLSIVSGHTRTTNRVDVGQSVIIPHTAGEIQVQLKTGKTWSYDIDVPLLRESECVSSWNRWLVAGPSLRLYLGLYPDGTLYALPISTRSGKDLRKHQPLGYPIKPKGTG